MIMQDRSKNKKKLNLLGEFKNFQFEIHLLHLHS